MVAALDARSEYWPPDEFIARTRSPVVGTAAVGMELRRGDGTPEVVSLIEDGPAARAGVAVGERLVEIDGWPTAGAPLGAVVQRLRGAPQSAVTLVFERDGTRRTLTLQREPVKPFTEQTLRLGILEPGGQSPRVWHLAIRKFEQGTLRELDTAGSKALSDGHAPAGGIILDLRDNTGGLLTTMVSLASAFLREGLPVGQIDGRSPRAKQRFVTGPRPPASYRETTLPEPLAATLKSAPLLVLVNDDTASGAEMLAAALQSNGRGRVAGLPTAGVGTIQSILTLTGTSAIKLTTSVWTGPRGEPLEGRGVTPDVTITTARGSRARARATGEDTELAQALEVLRRAPR
jgi:carboxyl-terminal processing protease